MAKAGYGDLEVGAETSSVQAVHPAGTAAAPGLTFSADADTGIYRVGANEVGISTSGAGQISIVDGVLQPITTNDIDLGTASLQFKNAWFDGTLEADAITIGGVAISATPTATTVTASANNSTDETVYPAFVDGATGTQGIETDTGLTYNPSSGILTSTQFTGAVSGNATTATTATNVTASANNSTDETVYPTFVDGATGGQGIETDTGLTYNPSTGVLTSTQFTGAVSGNATSATTATTATNVTASANNSTDETVYPTFVDGATGGQGIETDTGLTYNPSTGVLTSTTFTGALTGNAATVTTNANLTGNVTSSGNATTLVLNDLSAAAVAVAADSIAIIDADDSGSKKESIADFVSAIAGTNITASSGQLSVASATVFTRAPAFFMG